MYPMSLLQKTSGNLETYMCKLWEVVASERFGTESAGCENPKRSGGSENLLEFGKLGRSASALRGSFVVYVLHVCLACFVYVLYVYAPESVYDSPWEFLCL